ncbi:MAG: hypothetical protein HQK83_01655 [Fibrobacteria bacterium]|nr:hypothetical protein [Fibrobacteria bacterium]
MVCCTCGCLIQGPWDYTPDNPPEHRGLWVSGYVIAGKPITNICVEKILPLDEEYTDAFSFYKSAEVTISGKISGNQRNITLTQHPEERNCFVGANDELPEKGESYELVGSITWDSAGQTITTRFSSTAQIPQNFQVRKTARAPVQAHTGMIDTAGNFDAVETGISGKSIEQLLANLSEEGQKIFEETYQDTILQLISSGDSVGLNTVSALAFTELAPYIQNPLLEYDNGDSLFFLTGDLYFLSHYFSSERSDDVGGAFISHNYSEVTGSFDNGLGPFLGIFEPDTADYRIEGTKRRMFMYPNLENDEWSLLDSMAVFNAFLYQGKNRLFFYGFEQAYVDYMETVVDGNGDPKIKPMFNVTGASGVFSGAVVDSFDVFIKGDTKTAVYTRLASMVANCKEENGGHMQSRTPWHEDKECRDYYPIYCDSIGWNDKNCAKDLIGEMLVSGLDMESFLDSMYLADSVALLDSLIRKDSLEKANSRAWLEQLSEEDSTKSAHTLYEAYAYLANGDDASKDDIRKVVDSLIEHNAEDSVLIEKSLVLIEEKDTLSIEDKFDSAGVHSPKQFGLELFEKVQKEGEARYCIWNNYPDSIAACSLIKEKVNTPEENIEYKSLLWGFCLDRKWEPTQCRPGLVSYCTDRPRLSEILCSHADEYCNENTNEPLCK